MLFTTRFGGYTLRPLDINDLQDFYNLVQNNRSRLELFFAGTAVATRTIKDTETHMEALLEDAGKKDFYPFVIIDNLLNKMIAYIQVKNIAWHIPKAELGYYIDASYERKGIITKSVSLVKDFCFGELKLNKLYLRICTDNIPSKKVAEKNGFTIEGILRNDYKTADGKLKDILYYGLLRKD